MTDYNRKKHAVYMLTYHVIFVTKYRRPVISDGIGDFMKKHAAYLCSERYGGELLSAETDKDHIHLLISLPPDMAPMTVINSLKTQLSKEIHAREDFMAYVTKYLYGDVPFWSASYFVATTGSVSMETVKAYIESQRTEEHHRKYEKTGKYSKKNKKSKP